MMKEMQRTRTKNPDILKLSNGSMVRGFVINSAAGTKSDKVRGQPADIIYVDEMDYIPDTDFKAVTAIIMDKKNTELWATTTPSGLKSKFYFLCTDKNLGYKEFHYPATVSPNWNEETERYMRQQYNESEYVHEIMAEFGDVSGGWYPRSVIDASLRVYDMNEYVRREGCLYAIGLDWNEAPVGLQGCIVEYSPGQNLLTMVGKFNMSDSEFTQLKSIEKVVEMNAKWKPNLIWADAGFGTTQIETLKRYAMEHPSLGILSKIRGLNMGSTEEIRDPWNGEIRKKRMKTLISDVSLRQMEMGRCLFPASEDQKNMLVDELRSYRVDHYNQLGDPVFAKMNDHMLTAWQVAVYAMVITYSNLNKVMTMESIAAAPAYGVAKNRIPDFQYTGSLRLPKKVTDEMRKNAIAQQQHSRSVDFDRVSLAPDAKRDGLGRRTFEGSRSDFRERRQRRDL
jgi:replicative DNA helicase